MSASKKSGINIVIILMIILVIYNVMYWPGKFFPTQVPAFFLSFYNSVKSHWGLMMLLEFLGIASIFVEAIANFDDWKESPLRWKLILTFLIVSAFIARFLLGMIDVYMDGNLR